MKCKENMLISKRLIKLTQDLVRIDSQNPPGNEKAIAFLLRIFFLKAIYLQNCGNLATIVLIQSLFLKENPAKSLY